MAGQVLRLCTLVNVVEEFSDDFVEDQEVDPLGRILLVDGLDVLAERTRDVV